KIVENGRREGLASMDEGEIATEREVLSECVDDGPRHRLRHSRAGSFRRMCDAMFALQIAELRHREVEPRWSCDDGGPASPHFEVAKKEVSAGIERRFRR